MTSVAGPAVLLIVDYTQMDDNVVVFSEEQHQLHNSELANINEKRIIIDQIPSLFKPSTQKFIRDLLNKTRKSSYHATLPTYLVSIYRVTFLDD